MENEMATRQEIQIALDLIKHVNVPNDLLLSAAIPITAGEMPVSVGTIDDAQASREMTLAEKKAHLATLAAQIKGYRVKCETFLAVSANRTMAESGLAALGLTVADLETDIAILKVATDRMAQGAKLAADTKGMEAVGTTLTKDTPALPLVRKG